MILNEPIKTTTATTARLFQRHMTTIYTSTFIKMFSLKLKESLGIKLFKKINTFEITQPQTVKEQINLCLAQSELSKHQTK